jgi:hypothetical protein
MRIILPVVLIIVSISCIEARDVGYIVRSQSGLRILEEPGMNSKELITVTKGERIKIVSTSDKLSTYWNRIGHWTKVSYMKYTGWVIDANLPPEDGNISDICSLHNVLVPSSVTGENIRAVGGCKFDDGNNFPVYTDCISKIDLSKKSRMDDFLFWYNDDVVIISNNRVYDDKIRRVKVSYSETNGMFLIFDMYRDKIDLYRSPTGAIFNKKALFKKYNDYPVITKTNSVPLSVERSLFVDYIADNYEIYANLFGYRKPENIKKEIDREFGDNYVITRESIAGKHNYSIIKFTKNTKDKFDNMVAVLIDNKLAYFNSGMLLAAFTLNGKQYFTFEFWENGTGCFGKDLYMADNGILKCVISEYPFAN